MKVFPAVAYIPEGLSLGIFRFWEAFRAFPLQFL